MSDDIELVSDGDGLALFRSSTAVEVFLRTHGLDDVPSKELPPPGRSRAVRGGAIAAQTGSALAAGSGRWVQVTERSADLIAQHGLMAGNDDGVARAVVQGADGKIKGLVELVTKPGSVLANPAVLAGVAGVMTQLALQQSMDEIQDYLEAIDKKVKDVLRAQQDAVLADMIGVDLVIKEALAIREEVGRVSQVTWSKVQSTSMTIARTHAYALRSLDAVAEKLEAEDDVDDLAKVTRSAEQSVREWLAVLAHCFQLQDGIALLELDRVLDASPDELDRHRLGLRRARHDRQELIGGTTRQLIERMGVAASTANKKVLFNPLSSPAVVRSTNEVVDGIHDFQVRLGIESAREAAKATTWRAAAGEARDKVLTAGADGVVAARRFGGSAVERVSESFRAVDIDGDGIPDQSRARSAVDAAGSKVRGFASGAVGRVGSLLRRRSSDEAEAAQEAETELEPEHGDEVVDAT